METEFTPILSLLGGMLIGLSALLFMAFNGRIAGISGIVGKILRPASDHNGLLLSVTFVVGLLAAAPLYQLVIGSVPQSFVSGNYVLLTVAGLLVGIGSCLGNGCTSGHGVCGISRFSIRSIVATLTFMFTAFVTVYLLRHVWGA